MTKTVAGFTTEEMWAAYYALSFEEAADVSRLAANLQAFMLPTKMTVTEAHAEILKIGRYLALNPGVIE